VIGQGLLERASGLAILAGTAGAVTTVGLKPTGQTHQQEVVAVGWRRPMLARKVVSAAMQAASGGMRHHVRHHCLSCLTEWECSMCCITAWMNVLF